jgi:hypothetical protein
MPRKFSHLKVQIIYCAERYNAILSTWFIPHILLPVYLSSLYTSTAAPSALSFSVWLLVDKPTRGSSTHSFKSQYSAIYWYLNTVYNVQVF